MTETAEKRRFSMHPKLLHDVIMRQAGSVAKAILEGVMNSADAGATYCRVTVNPESIVIEDDGRGFRNKQEIADWFEVFGQPHEESEGKTFGRFRMGRGQLLAYGVNLWETQEFSMLVDFKNKGDQYELQTRTQKTPGCRILIDLYEQLYPSTVSQTERDVKLWCRWMPIKVYLNDTLISNKADDFDWTETTDEAYIELNGQDSLEVYNLGAHVKSFPKYTYGIGGEVVSRQALQVNFARNDIMSDCPIWRKLLPLIDQKAKDRNTHSKSLDDAQRRRLARQARDNELSFVEWRVLPIFTAVTGRHFKSFELLRFKRRITVAPKGNRLGDMLHRRGVAFVLAQETLERFGFASLANLVAWLREKDTFGSFRDITIVPFEELTAGMDVKYEILPDDKLNPTEKIWVELAQSGMSGILLSNEQSTEYRPFTRQSLLPHATDRKVMIGLSKGADGWTDAATYIAINKKFLAELKLDLSGFVSLGALLLHECCHQTPDLDDHDHDQAFYELYHDNSDKFLARFVKRAFTDLPQILTRHNKRLSKQQLKRRDTEFRGKQNLEKFEQVAARG